MGEVTSKVLNNVFGIKPSASKPYLEIMMSLAIILIMGLPARAGAVYDSLIDSTPQAQVILYIDRYGRAREQKVTVYTYITKEGKKIKLPYKIPHLIDRRSFDKKHPIIYNVGKMIIGPVGSYAF
jgi:hypothetical protein